LFAVVHGIHLIELLLFVSNSESKLVPIRLVGGFFAYVLIFSMPILAAINKRTLLSTVFYSRAALFFGVYIWFIFFMSYLPRVLGTLPHVGGAYWEHVMFFVLVIAVGLTHAFRLYKRKHLP
jgi:hypothetical protein